MVGHEKSPAGRRLAGASSAYLRSAAEQSIDWHPWGSEPFELAKSLRRPVLLDVGATWCHWCHVMDEGTYSDGEVARLIAEHFVAIKVDRDEHPEVDRRYQRQVGALTGEGGWPLTAFLTPDGMAFLGGTYFPAEDGHHGRPGLRRVLREVARIYAEEPEKVDQNTGALRDALARMRSHGPPPGPAVGPTALIAQVAERLATSYDPVHAGFGHAPKFPHPSGLSFLLWSSFATGDARSAARARETLLRMADGGLFDQLGGGFHRYSVDEGWHVPHFEKMAIDNAALLGTYVEGAARFADARLEETAGRTARWIVEVLERTDGGFGASQDADNAPGDDGRFFTWSRAELRAILSEDELKAVTRHFGIGTEGRMPQDPDQNVLYRLMPVAEVARTIGRPVEEVERTIAGATAKMQEARARRPVPFVDPARYGLINGALIGALSRAGRFLGDPRPIASARRAADAFLERGFDRARGVAHRLGTDGGHGFGLLEDNAAFALGLVELAGATAEPRYAVAAGQLLSLISGSFSDGSGVLTDVAPALYEGPVVGALDEPVHPIEDAPNLSPNALVAIALVRWSSLAQDDSALDRARALVEGLARRLDGAGIFAAGAAWAGGLAETPPARVVIEGDGPAAEALARAAERGFHPNLWVFRGPPPAPFSMPEELARAAAGRSTGARALVCFGTRCRAPITDPAELAAAIASADRPSR